MPGKDQRLSKRVPIALKVDWKCEGNFLYENATNISEHGIFIETSTPMKPGTYLDLEFALPDQPRKRIKVLGEVVWVNPIRSRASDNHNPGMGVRFVDLSQLDKETILSLIKRVAIL